jgi:bifunctional DNA-binding transcriptional regulator/antitoxin component of YhaV-PrlF toxin-antitoxin module
MALFRQNGSPDLIGADSRQAVSPCSNPAGRRIITCKQIHQESTMHTLKLISVGDSLAVVLPTEILERFKWTEGDAIELTETLQDVRLAPQHPDAAEVQIKLAREIMQARHAVLEVLAK